MQREIPNTFDLFTAFREPVSGLTHLVGAVLALGGTVWLAFETFDDPWKLLALLVYGVSMVLVYTASTVMHLYNGSPRVIDWLNRCDHASIYLFIAGSYTPFCYIFLSGTTQWLFLAVMWGVALIGATTKVFCYWGGHFSTALYVFMGWMGLLVAPQVFPQMPIGLIALLVGGGLVYTIGAVIFALEKPNFHRHFGYHELWHIFVMVGSALLFVAVMLYVV